MLVLSHKSSVLWTYACRVKKLTILSILRDINWKPRNTLNINDFLSILSCLIYNYSISGEFHRFAVEDLYCRVGSRLLFAAGFVGLMLARRGYPIPPAVLRAVRLQLILRLRRVGAGPAGPAASGGWGLTGRSRFLIVNWWESLQMEIYQLDESIYWKKHPNPQQIATKVFQWFLVVFDIKNNILKVPQYPKSGKPWFSRWRPRWPPKHKNGHNAFIIRRTAVILVSTSWFSGSRNTIRPVKYQITCKPIMALKGPYTGTYM